MIKTFVVLGAALAARALSADNLFPHGDFTQAKETLAPHATAYGGVVRPVTEDTNWNRCGRLEVNAVTTNEQGTVKCIACVILGSDGKTQGVPVEGGKIYDFSLEVRGEFKTAIVGASAWTKGFWSDRTPLKTTLPPFSLKKKEWTVYRGSFTVPEGKTRAALHLQVYDECGKGQKLACGGIGAGVYFDNVKFELSQDGFAAANAKAKPVPTVKSLASGTSFDDFYVYDSATGCSGVSPFGVRAAVICVDEALEIDVTVDRKPGNVLGKAGDPWSGDCLEAFFAPTADDPARRYSQFAWNAAGATFARAGSRKRLDGFKVVRNEVKAGVWHSRVRLPLKALGFTKAPVRGATLPFNLGFTGRGAGYASWAPVAASFADVPKFGRFCFGSYAEALKANWQADEAVADRAAFEKRVSEIETAAKQAELDRFKTAGFTVSVVPVESDYAMPFVPREAFHPVSNIHVRAAVNERTGIPVVVLNTTDVAETYVVRLETNTARPTDPHADKEYNGTWGLEGFPESQVVARVAVPMKDTESEPVTTRLDPLPKMDEACTVRILPHEAGLVWFDFDTAGVKPGTYRGRVRVIPLSQPSKFTEYRGYGMGLYEGKMQDVPVALEVLPITLPVLPSRPMGFFQPAFSASQFDLMQGIGTREFSDSPGSYRWGCGQDGKIRRGIPNKDIALTEKRIRQMRAWGKEKGFEPTFFIGFSAFDIFKNYCSPDPKRVMEDWPDFLRDMKKTLNSWGVDDRHYTVEVYDEPEPERYDEVKRVLELARQAVPTMRLSLTMAARMFPLEKMRELMPLVDTWTLWSTGNFEGEDRQAFVRDALAAGKEVWHYTCSTSGRCPVYGWYRLHPWYGLRFNLTGNQFFWFQNNWGGFGTADFKTRVASGIVYSSFGSTMPSLRYMAMRRGVTDLKYFDVLTAVAGDRDEVKKFLAEAPVRVVETERHDRTAADRMREKAIELILKYGNGK